MAVHDLVYFNGSDEEVEVVSFDYYDRVYGFWDEEANVKHRPAYRIIGGEECSLLMFSNGTTQYVPTKDTKRVTRETRSILAK